MEFSDHFGTSNLQEYDLEQVVEKIHLYAYTNENNVGDNHGRSPTNHWTIFLQLNVTRFVQVDMIPGDGDDGLLGLICLESKDVMTCGIKTLTFIPMRPFTVKDVINLIMDKGRDRYIFTDEEEGCRFWICTLVKDLEEAGKISENSGVDAVRLLSCYWVFPSGFIPREMEAGTFF